MGKETGFYHQLVPAMPVVFSRQNIGAPIITNSFVTAGRGLIAEIIPSVRLCRAGLPAFGRHLLEEKSVPAIPRGRGSVVIND